MTASTRIIFLLFMIVHQSVQRSTPTSSTYKAAVVELKSILYENDSARTLNDNAERFVMYIDQAGQKDVDIIVFPELGLTSLEFPEKPVLLPRTTPIPDPSQHFAPCTNFSIPVIDALRVIACATQRNSIYVVVNLFEQEACSGEDCPSDGIFLYITSVTFDREGIIVARCRKTHLIEDFGVLKPLEKPDISTFDTDFGVTFGHIVCFDIMYEEPSLALTRKLNVTDIILSSGWFSTMPLLTTIQFQSGWAYAEDVNLLTSGHNSVEEGYSGSGIYAGRDGIVAAILPFDLHEELLIANVRKKFKNATATPTPQHNDDHHHRLPNVVSEHHTNNELDRRINLDNFDMKYAELGEFKSQVIAEDGFIVKTLNHGEIECTFQVNLTGLSPPVTYHLLALDGILPCGELVEIGTRICAIVQCANDTIESCGHIQDSAATFNSIKITAMYIDNMRTVMMPNTLATNIFPLKNWSFNQYKQSEQVFTSISLTATTRNLVTFGLWGRNFENDKSSLQNL